MHIQPLKWLLTSYILSLLYIGSAYHYMNLLKQNFLLTTAVAVLAITAISLIIHTQNKKILSITALVATIFYIVINASIVLSA